MRVIGMDIHRTFAEVVFWEAGQLRPAGRIDMTPLARPNDLPACPAWGEGRNADAGFICASKRSQTDGRC